MEKRKNYIMFMVVTLLMTAAAQYFLCYRVYRNSGVKCVYDLVGFANNVIVAYMMYGMYVMLTEMKDDYRNTVIIRQQNMIKIWNQVVTKVVKIAVFYGAYLTAVIWIIPFTITTRICNFSEWKSFVSIKTGKVYSTAPSVPVMILSSFVGIACLTVILGMIMMFAWWNTSLSIVAYVVSVIILIVDNIGIGVYSGWTSMNSVRICKNGFSATEHLLYPILLSLGVYIVLTLLFRKKDMIRDYM